MPKWELRFKSSDAPWFATLLRLAFSTVALRDGFDTRLCFPDQPNHDRQIQDFRIPEDAADAPHTED